MRGLKFQDIRKLSPFFAAFVLLILATATVFFVRSPYFSAKKDGFYYTLHEIALASDLRLTEVFVRGRDRTPQKELLDVVNVERGMPLTAINIHATRQKIQKLPWIKTVQIERRLPHILYISVQERTPIAVWQNQGTYQPIDSDGQLVETFVSSLEGMPLILGTDAPEKTPELLSFLSQEPDINKRVKAAVRVGQRRWNILLDDIDNGIIIRLPERDPAAAWSRLARLNNTQGLLKRKVTMIDLRQPDKLTVQLEEQPKTKKSSSKASRSL